MMSRDLFILEPRIDAKQTNYIGLVCRAKCQGWGFGATRRDRPDPNHSQGKDLLCT